MLNYLSLTVPFEESPLYPHSHSFISKPVCWCRVKQLNMCHCSHTVWLYCIFHHCIYFVQFKPEKDFNVSLVYLGNFFLYQPRAHKGIVGLRQASLETAIPHSLNINAKEYILNFVEISNVNDISTELSSSYSCHFCKKSSLKERTNAHNLYFFVVVVIILT